jgi:diguanylate cyclase (GGDEF)-like protein/PAS domain S-box-containing protein
MERRIMELISTAPPVREGSGSLLCPRSLVIGLAVLTGAISLGLASQDVANHLPTWTQVGIATVFALLAFGNWVRPLVMFHRSESEAVHLDEGLVAAMLLLVRPSLAVTAFGAATIAAQAFIPRSAVKAAFNSGQAIASAGVAALVFQGIASHPGRPDWSNAVAAIAAAAAYYATNNLAIVSILGATGVPWSEALFDGVSIRSSLDVIGMVLGIAVAFLVAGHHSMVPVALLPLVLLRFSAAGLFKARRDRERLEGLFQATLAANRSMEGQPEAVAASFLDSVRELLRCQEAHLSAFAPTAGQPSAHVTLGEEDLWLTVSGRNAAEPFDAEDHKFLDALAAVATTSLANSRLYQQSQHERKRLAAITSNLGEGVFAVSRSGQITFANPAASNLLGLGPVRDCGDLQGVAAPDCLWPLALSAITTRQTITSYDVRIPRPSGGSVEVACTAAPYFEDHIASGAVIVCRDISGEKKLADLTYQAFHDSLTGMANRLGFLSRLDEAIVGANSRTEASAVLFIGIDRFKVINDSLGHALGNIVLISVAERIQTAVGRGYLVARYGGDEFTVLCRDVAGVDEATTVAQAILANMQDPIELPDGHKVIVDVSIGIALTSPGARRDDVLHDADVAMAEAKQSGSGHCCVFDPATMTVRSAHRLELEIDLREAIDQDQFEVYFQPIVSASNGTIASVEALVRWNHPVRGVVGPVSFIDLAEETGLIRPLGNAVLAKACRRAREWADLYGLSVMVGVNLSPRQFQHAGLLDEIREIVCSTGVDPAQLCFEITETMAMQNPEQTRKVLDGLKSLGALVAIDDFGTGHSALGYLPQFPIDVVKIDRTFVDGVEHDPVKSAVITAVVAMAKAINATTVVEGVETESQLQHLRSLGCDLVQGFYFSPPMVPEALERLLAAQVLALA